MKETKKVIERFNDVFLTHDPAGLAALLAEDCVLETIEGGPDGNLVEGRSAAVEYWSAIASDTNGVFEVEDVHIAGEWATILWTYRFPGGRSRGVNITRVVEGRIVRSAGYGKAA